MPHSAFIPPELLSQTDKKIAFTWDGTPPEDEIDAYFKNSSLYQKINHQKIIHQVWDRAKKIVRHPTTPTKNVFIPFNQAMNLNGELALEESIEENPLLSSSEQIIIEQKLPSLTSCSVMLDVSRSMAGDKHYWLTLGCAVILQMIDFKLFSIICFSSSLQTIHHPHSQKTAFEILSDLLSIPPQGYTNLQRALSRGLENLYQRRKTGILLSDGSPTEGSSALKIASQFDFLVVLHLEERGSNLSHSIALARSGHGKCLVVNSIKDLPRRVYEAVCLTLNKG